MRGLVLLVVSWCVACRSGFEEVPDGAPSPDATASSFVTIVATASGNPMPDATVYVHDARGVVGGRATTDASGQATVPPGAYVTLRTPFRGETASFQLLTLADVVAGDIVRFDAVAPPPDEELSFQLTVPEDPGAAGYLVFTTCSDASAFPPSGTGTLDLAVSIGRCSGLADVAVVSTDDQGRFLRALVATTMVTPGGSVSPTGSYAVITPSPIIYQDVPSTIAGMLVERTSVSPRGRLATVTAETTATGGTAAVDVAVPVMPDSIEVITTRSIPTPGAFARHSQITWGSPASERTISLGARLRDYATSPLLDLVSRRVDWSETASSDVIPAHASVVLYTVADQLGWTWRIAAARTGTSLAVPQLPAELDATFALSSRTVIADLAVIGAPPPVEGSGSGNQVEGAVLALRAPATFTGNGEVLEQSLYYAGDL